MVRAIPFYRKNGLLFEGMYLLRLLSVSSADLDILLSWYFFRLDFLRSLGSRVRFSKVPVTLRARNQMFNQNSEIKAQVPANKQVHFIKLSAKLLKPRS